jgi:hypothetical protein
VSASCLWTLSHRAPFLCCCVSLSCSTNLFAHSPVNNQVCSGPLMFERTQTATKILPLFCFYSSFQPVFLFKFALLALNT